MPKTATELSALAVKRLSHPGGGRGIVAYSVGGVPGLMLAITPTGGRSWVLRTVVGGKRRKLGLGGYPEVGLAQAREAARGARAQIAAGVDPAAERKAAQAVLRAAQSRMTFGEALAAFHAEKGHEFRSEKHRKQWRAETERLVGEELGPMAVDEITTQDVLRALRPHWGERVDTARRVRGRIENVLDWAVVAGHRPAGDNPARWKGNLAHLLPAPRKVAQAGNQPAVALDDLPRWWADLASREGMAAAALRFLAVTAARSGEVRGATWAELDLERAVWIVPAARTKTGKEHRVPLPAEAVVLLRDLPRNGGDTVFWAARGGPLSDMSVSAVMRRMNEAAVKRRDSGYLDPASKRPAVPHGLRSSFRDWAAERTSYPGEMAELALGHKIANAVEAAYRRGDQFEKRRRMMADWAAALRGEDRGAVVPLRGAGA